MDAIIIESLVILEKILGSDSAEYLSLIRTQSRRSERNRKCGICIRLPRRQTEIAQRQNKSILLVLTGLLFQGIYEMIKNRLRLRQNFLLEVLQETVFEHEKQMDKLNVAT